MEFVRAWHKDMCLILDTFTSNGKVYSIADAIKHKAEQEKDDKIVLGISDKGIDRDTFLEYFTQLALVGSELEVYVEYRDMYLFGLERDKTDDLINYNAFVKNKMLDKINSYTNDCMCESNTYTDMLEHALYNLKWVTTLDLRSLKGKDYRFDRAFYLNFKVAYVLEGD